MGRIKKSAGKRRVVSEDVKARLRAYYRANKDKWKTYRRNALERMSEAEREALRNKQQEYSRACYQANRAKIVARTTKYQHDHIKEVTAYRAKWYQQNKRKIAARRRRHYHAVVKPRKQSAKALSGFLSIREAASALGANLEAFREWVYAGQIDAERSPGGRYRIAREVVEHVRATCHHYPAKIRKRLGLGRNGGAP